MTAPRVAGKGDGDDGSTRQSFKVYRELWGMRVEQRHLQLGLSLSGREISTSHSGRDQPPGLCKQCTHIRTFLLGRNQQAGKAGRARSIPNLEGPSSHLI